MHPNASLGRQPLEDLASLPDLHTCHLRRAQRLIMGRRFIVTDPDELHALYVRRNWDLRKIAHYYGCSPTTVASACARFGILTRWPGPRALPDRAPLVTRWASEPTVIDIQLRIEHNDGATVAQLAHEYGLASGRVVDALLRTRVDDAA